MKAKHALALLLVVTAVAACSDDDDEGQALGEVCTPTAPCIEGARCDARGFCTKSCSNHEDCNCAPGTTDSDIAARSCPVACERGSCVKVCSTDNECTGSTLCLGGAAYSRCE